MTNPTGESLITIRQLCQIVPKSKATIYRWVKAGLFPQPIKVNNSTFWKSSDISAWIAEQTTANTAQI